MNYSMIIYILGWILSCEGILILPSYIVALVYGEFAAGNCLLIAAALCLILGFPITRKKPSDSVFYTKEGFVTVALCWIVISIMGSLPFVFSGVIPNPIDALFETVSGFTTTGASILTDVDAIPKCLIFWRSFTHWIGGMGILVFLLAFIPMNGGYHMNLMKAESPGPSVEKLFPTVQSTAKTLYKMYLFLTVLQVILLLIGKMPLFDALTMTFGTAGTGGFGIHNDSAASYSPYCQYIITIFMILFGVNFSVYFLIMIHKTRKALQTEEIRYYLGIIVACVLIIMFNIRHMYPTLEETFRHAAFQVASIITTTGYSTTDFNYWPELSRNILLLIMFVGACAGSTGGGIKVSRIIILVKSIGQELRHFIHPRSVTKITVDRKVVSSESLRGIYAFLAAYLLIFVISVLLVSLDNLDGITNISAVASAFNNIGPGLNEVGPLANFSVYSNFSTFILTMDMLAGRLEIFPLLLLFTPETWKKF